MCIRDRYQRRVHGGMSGNRMIIALVGLALLAVANAQVTTVPFAPADKDRILDVHNRVRADVAGGKFINQKAASLPALSWDDELAKGAETWAQQHTLEHCELSERTSEKYKIIGENIFKYYASTEQKKALWKAGVNAWFYEFKSFLKKKLSLEKFEYDADAGQFTQLVWEKTTHIGCAATQSKSEQWFSIVIVCRYGNGGNIPGEQIYKVGEPCSACSGKCSATYKTLCEAA
eukprot:TRINITY_DN4347_c0_g1_i6.p1 TRINITY_DN4347_c0_g1~~TRINITY_DN4347_c0_g1_i6.p1  ORF type:complete len:232 (+),score=73.39 TRINITY_DN4347_c0_g1_i6:65-760(+)